MRAGFMLPSIAVLIAATLTCADAMGQKVGETVEEVSSHRRAGRQHQPAVHRHADAAPLE
jgi:hypothetical protein